MLKHRGRYLHPSRLGLTVVVFAFSLTQAAMGESTHDKVRKRAADEAVAAFRDFRTQLSSDGAAGMALGTVLDYSTQLAPRVNTVATLNPPQAAQLQKDLKDFAVLACPVLELACSVAPKGGDAERICRSGFA